MEDKVLRLQFVPHSNSLEFMLFCLSANISCTRSDFSKQSFPGVLKCPHSSMLIYQNFSLFCCKTSTVCWKCGDTSGCINKSVLLGLGGRFNTPKWSISNNLSVIQICYFEGPYWPQCVQLLHGLSLCRIIEIFLKPAKSSSGTAAVLNANFFY